MGKTEKKKEKELKLGRRKYKRREFVTQDTFKLLEKKKLDYTKEQLEQVIELLKQEKRAQEISLETGMTTRQVKHVRYILKKGNQKDIEDLMACQYYFSSIRRRIKELKQLYKYINDNIPDVDDDDDLDD